MRGFRLSQTVAAFTALIVAGGSRGQTPTPQSVLQDLNWTIEWYHNVVAAEQAPENAADLLYFYTVRQNSQEVVRLGIEVARAQAAILAAGDSQTRPSSNPSSNDTKLAQAQAAAALRISQIQQALTQVRQQIAQSSGSELSPLTARRDKLAAELELANARQQALQRFAGFIAQSSGAGALGRQIDELESSVPEVGATTATTRPAPAAAPTPTEDVRPESMGILALIGQMFTVSHRIGEIKDLVNQTQSLQKLDDSLQAPIRAQLQQAILEADRYAASTDSSDPAVLARQQQQIQALTANFRLVSAVAVPLGEQNRVLGTTANTLSEWRTSLQRQYNRTLRALLIRIGAMAAAIMVLLGISYVWRHATFRYVSDPKRRRQFLLIRRLVVGVIIILVLIAGIISEFGSLATYAGLLTAGIAVALQTVILSGVAHFFFIGRYGVRVGDRVTISGVTGDVVEVGLFRLYLMELGGTGRDLQPTGRIVVFSNSVLFQPSAFYKQIPGADFSWHEVAMTLSPESDYHLAEKALLGAVERVYAEYRPRIEAQHESARESLHMPLAAPKPEARLRFVEAGLEIVIRYPVENRRATQIDDQVTRALVETIDKEPKLRLVATSTPTIQPAANSATTEPIAAGNSRQ